MLQRLNGVATKRPAKLGLESMELLLAALENPQKRYQTIHIAGTNGKGSVAWKLARALELSGHRTGLYTSPHLTSFRERVRIDGELISEELAVERMEQLFGVAEACALEPTFFELVTLLAFHHFACEGVDVAVIETGLGGRLDATNVIRPECSVITSIALDHTALLGSTRRQIAKEKAGIVKPGVPLVLGPRASGLGIEEVASDCTVVSGTFPDFLEENKAIAACVLRTLNVPEAGLDALPAGRFERVSEGLLFDVAHNPDGLQHLFQAIASRIDPGSVRAVVALSSGKEPAEALKIIRRHAESVHLVDAEHERLLPLSRLKDAARRVGMRPSEPCGSVERVLPALLVRRSADELIVVCGSCFIMDAARTAAI